MSKYIGFTNNEVEMLYKKQKEIMKEKINEYNIND